MENKEWDEGLKDMLGNFRPEGLKPDWDAFSNYMNVHEQMSVWEEDEAFDESLKESVSGFEAPPKVDGWERIEASLNLADQQFDEHVRDRIHQYEPKYNPHAWTLFLQRFSGIGYLRAKLIAFKVVEVAAVILLLFTAVKMGQMGKLPFETPLFDKPSATPPQNESAKAEMADLSSPDSEAKSENQNSVFSGTGLTEKLSTSSESTAQSGFFQSNYNQQEEKSPAGRDELASVRNQKTLEPMPVSGIHPILSKNELLSENDLIVEAQNLTAISKTKAKRNNSTDDKSIAMGHVRTNLQMGSAVFLSSSLSPVKRINKALLPRLSFVKQRSKTYTEFGIVSQVDYNRLRMPADKLYSAGRQIVFPEQGIPSTSLGGGFSFALGHPRWAIETGMVYSGKNFKPGRQLVVGDAFDNGSVEFEAMRLQLVSVPLHYRYRFDNKGAFKMYGLAGFGLHLIAQSNIDVLIKYHFPSLSIGENPNNDPNLAETIRETRRISEHIRDGAPFSTKSFFSLNAGGGIEYSISENKTLFLQSAIQYQVPNLKFSNNNGKHIRTISLQAGVRTPLGK